MIHVDESDPIGEVEQSFPPRDVTIKRGVDAKEIYELLTEIGRGKFGTVYKCREKSTGLQLAAKFVPMPKREDRRNAEREVEIMNSLQHSLIIQLYDAMEYQKMMCVVLELIEGGELFDRVIDDDFILTERACIVFIRQVCQAMEFIHRSNILHLDLKPENILCLTREGNRIKIIDFGLARKYDPDKKLQVLFGTPEFVAPEVVNFDRISFGTDMWSVGVICYVLLSGLSPFMGATDIATMANVTIGKYDFDDEAFSNVSKDGLDFISKLLVKESSNRMTASECLEHVWLKWRLPPPQKLQRHTSCMAAVSSDIIPKSALQPTISPTKSIPATLNDIQNDDKELKTTKDNLKSFIERWEEHPNSPYVFDINTNCISPITIEDQRQNNNNNNSVLSSRGCSPSPCGSISSETSPNDDLNDDVFDPPSTNNMVNNPIFGRQRSEMYQIAENGHTKLFKEYLQSFERRNSDSNCVLNRSSSCEKVNLAAEIQKLSERLMMLSSINTDLSNFNNDAMAITTHPEMMPSINNNIPSDLEKPKISTKKSENKTTKLGDVSIQKSSGKKVKNSDGANSKSSKVKEETTTSTTSTQIKKTSFKRTNSLATNSSCNKMSSNSNNKIDCELSERLKLLDDTPNLSKRLPKTTTTSIENNNQLTTTLKTTSLSSATTATTVLNGIAAGAPWPITTKRTKFRITQMSRDVPMNSPNSHQPVFLEESVTTTKDCLLHLLEKYNDTDTQPRSHTSLGTTGRHQSISEGFGISNNLEYRSMNSLNFFFQRHANAGTTVKQIQAQIESKHGGVK